MSGEAPPRTEKDLDERLSRPTSRVIAALADIPGDVMILGAGGKMGPSLARMVKRADPARHVMAVSRWSNASAGGAMRDVGAEVLVADLLDPAALAALPNAPNLIFMAGQKFGTSGNPSATWAANAIVPSLVSERFAGARTVVFSTGNVYALTSIERGGSREDDLPAPVGEYAYSCLARERIFTSAAERHATPVSIIRLNYAHDLRYGVLTDIAYRIAQRQPVDLSMSHVNAIWQGDANAAAIASLQHASAPEPFVVNVAGAQTLRVRDVALSLGARLRIDPVFNGVEGTEALLSNSSRMRAVIGDENLSLDRLLDWVADWVSGGGRLLGKPTHFEQRDGRF